MKSYNFKIVILLFLLIGLLNCKVKQGVESAKELVPSKTELPPPNILWFISEDNSKHYLKLFDKNGVETPNIESLTASGLIFPNAFSNAPVCSVARSTLISGCYAPRIGTQYHRKRKLVPMPDNLKMFTTYLREAGYYTTNKSKQDYNIIKSGNEWDESSNTASWRNRKPGQPFFHKTSVNTTHEGRLHFSQETIDTFQTTVDQETVHVAPIYPKTKTFKFTSAYYRDRIVQMDGQLGEVIAQLKTDGVYDDTFIFYFGDHGGVLPGSKGYAYERGLNIPLVIHIPENYKHLVETSPKTVNDFVSFIDFGATALALAGIDTPDEMDGRPFLTTQKTANRNVAFGYADRFDEKYDLVRTARKGKFKYIRNYVPYTSDGLHNFYRYKQIAYKEWRDMFNSGKLNKTQAAFFLPRKAEQLFDTSMDPYETNDLSSDPKYADQLSDLRSELNGWVKGMPDLSFYPEHHMINEASNNPTAYGQMHKDDISRYISIADLSLQSYADVSTELTKHLKSQDPWDRYWAAIVAASFGSEAIGLKYEMEDLANNDPENMVRTRAAEYLGMVGKSPVTAMTNALYNSSDATESLLIFNSIVLMQDGNKDYQFDLDLDKISEKVKDDTQVKRRLAYLGLIAED